MGTKEGADGERQRTVPALSLALDQGVDPRLECPDLFEPRLCRRHPRDRAAAGPGGGRRAERTDAAGDPDDLVLIEADQGPVYRETSGLVQDHQVVERLRGDLAERLARHDPERPDLFCQFLGKAPFFFLNMKKEITFVSFVFFPFFKYKTYPVRFQKVKKPGNVTHETFPGFSFI